MVFSIIQPAADRRVKPPAMSPGEAAAMHRARCFGVRLDRSERRAGRASLELDAGEHDRAFPLALPAVDLSERRNGPALLPGSRAAAHSPEQVRRLLARRLSPAELSKGSWSKGSGPRGLVQGVWSKGSVPGPRGPGPRGRSKGSGEPGRSRVGPGPRGQGNRVRVRVRVRGQVRGVRGTDPRNRSRSGNRSRSRSDPDPDPIPIRGNRSRGGTDPANLNTGCPKSGHTRTPRIATA